VAKLPSTGSDLVLARGRSPFTRRRHRIAPCVAGTVVDNVVAVPVDRRGAGRSDHPEVWRAADRTEIAVREPQRSIIFIPG
jgi:hypothetical protein